jgi:ParB family chromosome partitioning protein
MTADLRRTTAGLGRGLGALIPQREPQRGTVELPIASIARNPYQPRQEFDETLLAELAASIAEHGVLQPILVTEAPGGYRLVAGERRLRAAEMAGLDRVPALVRSADDPAQLGWALIENLQRSDLNALEEAAAFRRLVDEFGLSHEEVGTQVGRSRSAVANALRLLDLGVEVQQMLQSGRISEGHARAICGLESEADQLDIARAVHERGLSVRQTEELVRRRHAAEPARSRQSRPRSPDVDRLESGLRDALATKVSISTARRGGRITIDYYDSDDLERLYERLTGERL